MGASTYRLTFLVDRDDNPPTDEWKGKTAEAIVTWKQDLAQRDRARRARRQKQIPGGTCTTTVVALVPLPDTSQRDRR